MNFQPTVVPIPDLQRQITANPIRIYKRACIKMHTCKIVTILTCLAGSTVQDLS